MKYSAYLVLFISFITSPILFAQEKKHAEHAAPAAHESKPAQVSHGASPKSHGGGAHWSYTGDTGPSHWGDMKEDFKLCKSGRSQTPINIENASEAPLEQLHFMYQAGRLEIFNNGHTIQVNIPKGSFVRIGSKRYELLQFHFHTPSEHQLDGKNFELEYHFVHKDEKGNLAVVGVFLKPGQMNPFLQQVFNHAPAASGETNQVSSILFNPTNLLPAETAYYHYQGSLTTPPCSEGVKWFVLKKPLELSVAQIAKFKEFFQMNSRPVQPMHGRPLIML